MKSTTSPRWSCRIVRACRSIAGSESRPGVGARHIAECADCRKYFAAAEAFDVRLRRDASQHTQTPPFGLDQRIMRALAASERPAPQRRTRALPLVFAGATASLVVAFTFLQIGPFNAPSPLQPVQETRVIEPETQQAPAAVSVPLAQFTAPVQDALTTHSLDSEVSSVYADARSAVQFLAANFLPSGTAGKSGG